MLDLSEFDTTGTATLHLRHPGTGELLYADQDQKQPVTITLLSQDSEEWQKAQRTAINRRLNDQQRKMTAESLEEDTFTQLVAVTKAWTHVGLDGKDLDCTPANIRAVYRRLKWVRDQVDKFLGDRANFLGGGAG